MKQDFRIFLDFSRKLYRNRYMLKIMTHRDLKNKYIGSFFGIAWAVINPVAQVVIYGVVFGKFFASKPDPAYGTDSYMLYLMCGLVPWQFFSETISLSAGLLLANSNLIKKAVDFPSEILPIVTVLSSVISHLVGILILLVLAIVFNGSITLWALVVFVYVFIMIFFTVGLGWILSSLSVYLRDLGQVLGLLLMGGFFFTPIFYSSSDVPSNVLWFLKLNPIFYVVDGYRLTILAGKPPALDGLIYLSIVSAVCFAVGGFFFRRLKPGFAEVL